MGKMGRELAALAPERDVLVTATFDGAGDPISAERLNGAQVALEFTEAAAVLANVRACLAARCPVVVGTTGWYDELPRVAREVRELDGALLWAANFSVGVNLFLEMARAAGRVMAAASFDVHVVETHHAAKKDAPSGTALAVVSAAGEGLGRTVPISSVRTGHVPGTHELLFDGPFEQIRLEHTARDRRVFADGALLAARWLVGKRGVFTMADVLRESLEPG